MSVLRNVLGSGVISSVEGTGGVPFLIPVPFGDKTLANLTRHIDIDLEDEETISINIPFADVVFLIKSFSRYVAMDVDLVERTPGMSMFVMREGEEEPQKAMAAELREIAERIVGTAAKIEAMSPLLTEAGETKEIE